MTLFYVCRLLWHIGLSDVINKEHMLLMVFSFIKQQQSTFLYHRHKDYEGRRYKIIKIEAK